MARSVLPVSVVKKGLPVPQEQMADHFAALHGLNGFPLGVELADRLHADGRQHAVLLPHSSEGRRQRQRVDHGGAHAHLIALHAVETLTCTGETAENVAAADDDTDLHTHLCDLLNLEGIVVETRHVDALLLLSGETLARKLEKNSFEFHSFIFTSLNA